MHKLKIATFFLITFLFTALVADEVKEMSPISEILIDDERFANLDFDILTETESDESLESLLKNSDEAHTKALMVLPYHQGLALIRGEMCHIADYARCSIITVLQGPHYGIQTITTPNGFILRVKTNFFVDSTPQGIYLRHEYRNSTVITGSAQMVVYH